jgi:hypothetical protein
MSQSKPKLKMLFHASALPAGALNTSSAPKRACVQSSSGSPFGSRNVTLVTIVVGQTGMRSEAPPRRLSKLWTAYS